MSSFTPEELKIYETLPEDVKQAISSANSSEIITEIQKKNALHIDQSAALADEVGLLMLGITHPSQFIPNVQKRLRLSSEKAREIGTEVNERIFKQIRASLMEIHKMGAASKSKEDEEKPRPPKAVPAPVPPALKAVPPATPPLKDVLPVKAPSSVPAEASLPEKPPLPPPVPTQNVPQKDSAGGLAEEKLKAAFNLPKKTGEYGESDPYKEKI